MGRTRYDETWHRLREWTKGQTPAERLAGQVLIDQGFIGFDPSHPLGGRDGGKDGLATKDGVSFVMAVYFPRGVEKFSAIESKFIDDLAGAKRNGAQGIAFVTNQELRLSEREKLESSAGEVVVELYHLERVTAILDTPAMNQVREQFLDIAAEEHSINLGGEGGSAPSAGGGGGAAIGKNAKGGRGGPGGNVNLLGKLSFVPGAGSGGAGAVGDGAMGGDGGGGGDHTVFTLSGKELEMLHHIDIQVGKGGVGGPGEDSVLNICDEDGHVLRTVVTKGGKAGAPPYVPPPSRTPSEADIQAGLKIIGILASEHFSLRDGVWTMVYGGWTWLSKETNPFQVELPLLIEVATGEIESGSILRLKLVVKNPSGFQVQEKEQLVSVPDGIVRRTHFATVLPFSGSEPGLWRVEIIAGHQVIGEWSLEIRAPAHSS